MNYRLAMLDIDGTLQHRGRWNPGALELVDLLHARGITVALCSGRTTGSMITLGRELRQAGFLASNSGSTVLERRGEEWVTLAHRAMSAAVFVEAIGRAREVGLEVWVHTEREWLVAEKSELVDQEESFVGDVSTLDRSTDRDDVGKLLLLAHDPGHRPVARGMGELPGVTTVASSDVYVDVIPEVSASAKGGDVLVERLGLGWDEVIAIGDSENDRGMLIRAGLGIAVAPMTLEALGQPGRGQIRRSVADTAGALAALRQELATP